MKKAIALLSCIAMLFAACENYDDSIADHEARINLLEDNFIKSIEEQVAGINTSLADLQAVDSTLMVFIKELEATASDLQSQLEDTNAKMDELKDGLKEEISTASQALLVELGKLKSDIETQLESINQDIEALKDKDVALDGKTANLKTYVDNELAGLQEAFADSLSITEAWVKATFATIDQYDSLQGEISGVKGSIDVVRTSITELEGRINQKITTDISAAINALHTELSGDYADKIATAVSEVTANYTVAIATAKNEIEVAYGKAIKEAIEASEENMKKWVNETLAASYYDIATMDAKLATLATEANHYADQQVTSAVTDQQNALAQTKAELTAAYERAISDAINTNNGVVDTRISTAINNAKNEMQSKIDAINMEIVAIKNRLDTLEGKVEALIARIQSIRLLPDYDGGKAKLVNKSPSGSLTFILSPSEAAVAVAQSYNDNSDVVKAKISRIQTQTRSVDVPQALAVASVTGTADGLLTVEVDIVSLPEGYWRETKDANVFICISDGNNDMNSELAPIVYEFKPEAVDLGLSVKWASCNVGADFPKGYGDYFAWGETETKSDYISTNNITYGLRMSDLESRGFIDSDGNLTAAYDAATVNWDDSWRMPTLDEMKELVDNCTWEWTTMNGVNGRKATGPNGNSIFLPAAGFRGDGAIEKVGSYGCCWSATPTSVYTSYCLYFDSGNLDCESFSRYYGRPVRPVTE